MKAKTTKSTSSTKKRSQGARRPSSGRRGTTKRTTTKRSTRRNPDVASRELAAARRESERFHGSPNEVIRLSPKERKPLSEYVVVLGELEDVTYGPDDQSKRGDAYWKHEYGDRGPFRPKAKNKPILVADPITRQVTVVQGRSPAKFNDEEGIVG